MSAWQLPLTAGILARTSRLMNEWPAVGSGRPAWRRSRIGAQVALHIRMERPGGIGYSVFPMRSLDIITLAVIGLVLHTALFLVLFLTYATRKTYPGFRSWTASQACWVVAGATFFSRPWIGETVSIVVSNPFYLLCCFFIRQGMARFYGYDKDRVWFRATLAVLLASMLTSIWYKFVDDNVNMRIAGHSLGLSFLLLSAAVEPLVRGKIRSPIQVVLSACMIATSAVLLVRTWFALTRPVYSDLFAQDVLLKPALILAFFSMVMIVYGFIALTHERMERELLDTRERLEQLANTDELTGLTNRRHLTETARHYIRLARRYRHPVSFIIFDLDHFKHVNDSFGHGAGDDVLTAIAAQCRTVLRDVDTLARWGGEEFAVLMPETGLEEALRTAERLRLLLRELRPVHNEDIRTTASFGVAVLADESFEELAARADEALYRAKHEGRDRVCSAA